MNAEVTVKHLSISTHLIYTDSQNPPPFYEAATRKSWLSFDKGSYETLILRIEPILAVKMEKHQLRTFTFTFICEAKNKDDVTSLTCSV